MKIFQFLQKQLAIAGICNATSNESTINLARMTIVGGVLFYCVISLFVYIIHVASGFMEYVECICVASGSIILFVWFAAIVYQKTALFECIDKIQKLIDTSESHLLNYSLCDFRHLKLQIN